MKEVRFTFHPTSPNMQEKSVLNSHSICTHSTLKEGYQRRVRLQIVSSSRSFFYFHEEDKCEEFLVNNIRIYLSPLSNAREIRSSVNNNNGAFVGLLINKPLCNFFP